MLPLIFWLRFVAGVRHDRWDVAGAAMSVAGALLILAHR
jgi:drug/metabolite transporter superfamily protein YnfA